MDAGRLDTSPHPFTTMIGATDVRQTIRAENTGVFGSIYATLHETGHALYEQGLPTELLDLPVGRAPSLGMHESQSRMWENQVGRSREFTGFMLPKLKEHFPEQMGDVSHDEFYEGANHPKRSLIRVYADEVTYNLHLVLRFQIELALFRDEIGIDDLPSVWNEKSEEHLGIRPDTDGDGVLQDMHWSIGSFGYFPTYTLGTLYAAAFYEKVNDELNLAPDLARGDGSRLHKWLNDNVYSYAYMHPAKKLGEMILGEPLTVQPFIDYIKKKYGALYSVSF
jgi:carboxypeptidase Taq